MTLIKDLEELEGSKFLKQCNDCIYKEHPEGSDWCFMFSEAPISVCKSKVLSHNTRERNELNALFKEFFSLDK